MQQALANITCRQDGFVVTSVEVYLESRLQLSVTSKGKEEGDMRLTLPDYRKCMIDFAKNTGTHGCQKCD